VSVQRTPSLLVNRRTSLHFLLPLHTHLLAYMFRSSHRKPSSLASSEYLIGQSRYRKISSLAGSGVAVLLYFKFVPSKVPVGHHPPCPCFLFHIAVSDDFSCRVHGLGFPSNIIICFCLRITTQNFSLTCYLRRADAYERSVVGV
jgi:hypothetical protein